MPVIVGDSHLADVVHATDSYSGKGPTKERASPKAFGSQVVVGTTDYEGDEGNTDGKKERQSGPFVTILNLELLLTLVKNDGTISDEVHRPCSNTTHGYTGTAEKDAEVSWSAFSLEVAYD